MHKRLPVLHFKDIDGHKDTRVEGWYVTSYGKGGGRKAPALNVAVDMHCGDSIEFRISREQAEQIVGLLKTEISE